MLNPNPTFQAYVKSLGKGWQYKVAAMLGCSVPLAYSLASGHRQITPAQANLIHLATSGAVNRQLLIWGNIL